LLGRLLPSQPKNDFDPFGSRLYRNAIWVPGWHHIWDNLLKDSCRRQPWWKEFLKVLKNVVKWFRVDSHKQAVADELKGQLTPQQSKALDQYCASFAKWRWGTLFLACKQTQSLEFLRPLFHIVLEARFADSHGGDHMDDDEEGNKLTLEHVSSAMANKDNFFAKLRFSAYFSAHSNRRRTWASGCKHPEHEALRKKGKKVQCVDQGRRLEEAEDFLQQSKNELQTIARGAALQEKLFDADHELLLQARESFEYLAAMSGEKCSWVGQLPYLAAKMNQPQVCERMLQTFAQVPEEKWDARTLLLLSEKKDSLRWMVEQRASGGCMAPRLEAERKKLANMRITEHTVIHVPLTYSLAYLKADASVAGPLRQNTPEILCQQKTIQKINK